MTTFWQLTVPFAATNFIADPYPTSMTGGAVTNGSYGFSTRYRYEYTPAAGVYDGVYTRFVVAGITFPATLYFSVQLWATAASRNYRIYGADDAGAMIGSAYAFAGVNGRWMKTRAVVSFSVPAAGTYRVYVTKNNSSNTSPFYISDLQVEANAQTTFFDGDTPGCYWTGARWSSWSVAPITAREHGRLIDLQSTEWAVEQWTGPGMPPFQNVLLKQGVQSGATHQRTKQESRVVTLTSNINVATNNTLNTLHASRQDLIDLCKLDQTDPDTPQPFRLYYTGALGNSYLRALYDSGLDMNYASKLGFTEKAGISFVMPDPYVYEERVDRGQTSLADLVADTTFQGLTWYHPDTGQWTDMGVGVEGDHLVRDMLIGPDGKLYVVGDFNAPQNYLMRYNFDAAAPGWQAICACNGNIHCIYRGLGDWLYFGGEFTTFNGNPSLRIAGHNPMTGAYRYFAGGPSAGAVDAIAQTADGILLMAGSFTQVTDGGVLTDSYGIASWTSAAGMHAWGQWFWNGAAAGTVSAMTVDPDNGLDIYCCGNFDGVDLGGGVVLIYHFVELYRDRATAANYWPQVCGDPSFFNTNFIGYPTTMIWDNAGVLYLGGMMYKTDAGAIPYVYGLVTWNGAQLAQAGTGVMPFASLPRLSKDLDGNIIFCDANYSFGYQASDPIWTHDPTWTEPFVYAPGGLLAWTGFNYLPVKEAGQSGSKLGYALFTPRGIFACNSTTETGVNNIYGPQLVDIDYYGTAAGFPIIEIENTSTNNVVLTSVFNLQTGDALYFNSLKIGPGDQLTIDLSPDDNRISLRSRGGLDGVLLPGSHVSTVELLAYSKNEYRAVDQTQTLAVQIYPYGVGATTVLLRARLARKHYSIDGAETTP